MSKPAGFYDANYFLGNSDHRGKFSLLELGPKFYDRAETLINYFCLTSAEPGTIVEIGCGTAPFYRITQSQLALRHLAVVCTDISDQGVKLISENEQPPFTIASANNLPFEASSISGGILWDVLEHIDHPQAVLQEAYRVLKPGGFLHIICPNPESWLRDNLDPSKGVYRRDESHIFPPILTVEYMNKILDDVGFEFEQFTRGFEGSDIQAQRGLSAMRPAEIDPTGAHIVVFARKT